MCHTRNLTLRRQPQNASSDGWRKWGRLNRPGVVGCVTRRCDAGGDRGDEMQVLKSILLAGGAMLALASVAGAADLPTKKGVAPAPKPNCYATFWTWLDSTPADCPLSYWGVTWYGQI